MPGEVLLGEFARISQYVNKVVFGIEPFLIFRRLAKTDYADG